MLCALEPTADTRQTMGDTWVRAWMDVHAPPAPVQPATLQHPTQCPRGMEKLVDGHSQAVCGLSVPCRLMQHDALYKGKAMATTDEAFLPTRERIYSTTQLIEALRAGAQALKDQLQVKLYLPGILLPVDH